MRGVVKHGGGAPVRDPIVKLIYSPSFGARMRAALEHERSTGLLPTLEEARRRLAATSTFSTGLVSVFATPISRSK